MGQTRKKINREAGITHLEKENHQRTGELTCFDLFKCLLQFFEGPVRRQPMLGAPLKQKKDALFRDTKI